MTKAAFAAWVRASAPRAFAWARARAAERSTWIGLSMIAGALGKSVWADHLTHLGDVVPMLFAGAGAIAVGASTSTSTSTSAPASTPQP